MSTRSSSRETRLLWVSVFSLLGFLLMWEGLCRAGAVDPIFLPAPSQVLARALSLSDQGTLFYNVLASTRRVMVGFLAAVIVAIPLGILLGTSKVARAVFDPII